MHLTPAAYAIHVFGSATKLAEAAGVSIGRVSRWRGERGGAQGIIPAAHQRRILEKARERKLPLTAEDLICGRDVPQAVAAR